MTVSELFKETAAYIQTKDFVHGLVDGVAALVIQVILLSILVPVLIWTVNRIRTRRLRSIYDFYLFQIFHKMTDMFLSMCGVEDFQSFLAKQHGDNPILRRVGSFMYGNLEEKFFALNAIFRERDSISKAAENKTSAEYQRYLATCENCLEEIDRMIIMLMHLPKVQAEFFNLRLVVYSLRDLTEAVMNALGSEQESGFRDFRTVDLQDCAKISTETIEAIFERRRKLIESMAKHMQMLQVVRDIAGLPFFLIRRWAHIKWNRFGKAPYTDSYSPSYCAFLLRKWRQENGFNFEKAAKILQMTTRDYRDFEYGYRMPSPKEWEPVKMHLRGEVDYSEFIERADNSTVGEAQ